ncbi:MAG: 50S ribosomal protein L18 [Pseudomonadota bacterium]
MKASRNIKRKRRQVRIRKKIGGTPECPRLSVFKSAKHISAQLIDDLSSKTLASASTYEKDLREDPSSRTKEGAKKVGKRLAERAKVLNFSRVAFDRSGFRYHGRVKELADAAREVGLKF